jgi:threonyl-tRNA synthetase
MLSSALDKFVPGQWVIDEGDGAFYGPKIDITIQDALRRKHQCATIQLDFQLPQRFELSYRSAEGGEGGAGEKLVRPVMIHRAILGSVERFTAILTEHFAGKWPFWLSPRQVVVIPVAGPHKEYAKEVAQKLWDAGIYADADLSDSTLPKKVRNGEIAQYNFIFGAFALSCSPAGPVLTPRFFLAVVGSEEMDQRSVNVRNRDDAGNKKARSETIKLDEVMDKLMRLKNERRLDNELR